MSNGRGGWWRRGRGGAASAAAAGCLDAERVDDALELRVLELLAGGGHRHRLREDALEHLVVRELHEDHQVAVERVFVLVEPELGRVRDGAGEVLDREALGRRLPLHAEHHLCGYGECGA